MSGQTCVCHEQSGPCEACFTVVALSGLPSWDQIVEAYEQRPSCGKDASAGERVRKLVAKQIAPLLVTQGTAKPAPRIDKEHGPMLEPRASHDIDVD